MKELHSQMEITVKTLRRRPIDFCNVDMILAVQKEKDPLQMISIYSESTVIEKGVGRLSLYGVLIGIGVLIEIGVLINKGSAF